MGQLTSIAFPISARSGTTTAPHPNRPVMIEMKTSTNSQPDGLTSRADYGLAFACVSILLIGRSYGRSGSSPPPEPGAPPRRRPARHLTARCADMGSSDTLTTAGGKTRHPCHAHPQASHGRARIGLRG